MNVASRVQGLAASRSIVVTEQVVENADARALLESNGLNAGEPKRGVERDCGQGVGVRNIVRV